MLCLVEPIEAPSTAGDCFGIWDLGIEIWLLCSRVPSQSFSELNPKSPNQKSDSLSQSQVGPTSPKTPVLAFATPHGTAAARGFGKALPPVPSSPIPIPRASAARYTTVCTSQGAPADFCLLGLTWENTLRPQRNRANSHHLHAHCLNIPTPAPSSQ